MAMGLLVESCDYIKTSMAADLFHQWVFLSCGLRSDDDPTVHI